MMKINLRNTSQIEAALENAQENCRARLKDVRDIACDALAAERELAKMGIPKSKRIGAKVLIQSEAVPNSYKFAAYGTFATLIRGKNDWFLEKAWRGQASCRSYGGAIPNYLHLGEKAQEYIANKAKKPILF